MATNSDRGFTLIELMLVITIISIVAMISIPGLLRVRMVGNEVSAIGALRVTATAEIAYSATCGNGGYAATFVVLGTPIGGVGQAFISDNLGKSLTPQFSGYSFALGAGTAGVGPRDCQGTMTNSGYYSTATPLGYGSTGSRAFAISRDGAIWQHNGALPTSQPFVVGMWDFPIQ